ncbi:MAG: SUMF1/EgtB/PvdO family nonheme iron enzyme [Chitinivibrionales bacterium]|nr:SUMF1/EgtB/PvdO family nonheme iron enzyme [Chitinivibrionales bacterium]
MLRGRGGTVVADCWLLMLWLVSAAAQTVTVPNGEFKMGDNGGDVDERPMHTVRLSAYRIDAHEVTVASYDSCVAAGACSPAHYTDGKCILWSRGGPRKVKVPQRYRSDSFPVVCVSWRQARAYCRYKGKKLPTEAQWERAALGGAAGKYAWGDEQPSESRCTPARRNHPSPVGSYPPNGWGLWDMTGNVWEWVYDRYQPDYYADAKSENPAGPTVGRYRVIRGGGWYSGPEQLRVRNRHWFVPEYGEVSIGFRCAQ